MKQPDPARRQAPAWSRALALALTLAAGSAQATFIGNAQGGAEFPLGEVSFADAVVSYNPAFNAEGPTPENRGSANALGVPDYTADWIGNFCTDSQNCPSVTLGNGGSITLRFIDNRLTGSGDNRPDLWVFEVGTDIEDMFVEVSTDGQSWSSVGKVGGSTAGVDIDAFGFGTSARFAYVRLRDDPALDQRVGFSAGADIDAVGAISTVRQLTVPEPGALALLFAAGLAAATATRLPRRQRRTR